MRVGHTSDGSATGAPDEVASFVPSGLTRRAPIRINVNIAAAVVQGHLLATIRARIQNPEPRAMTLSCLPLQYEYLLRHDPLTMYKMKAAFGDITRHFINGTEAVGDEIYRESTVAHTTSSEAGTPDDASEAGSGSTSDAESDAGSFDDDHGHLAEELALTIAGLKKNIAAADTNHYSESTVAKWNKQLQKAQAEYDTKVLSAKTSASKQPPNPSSKPSTTSPTVMGLLYYISVLRGHVYTFC